MRLPWHRFLNYVYAFCVRRIPPEGREEWEYMMSLPLVGPKGKPDKHTVEAEGESFMNLLAEQGKV